MRVMQVEKYLRLWGWYVTDRGHSVRIDEIPVHFSENDRRSPDGAGISSCIRGRRHGVLEDI